MQGDHPSSHALHKLTSNVELNFQLMLTWNSDLGSSLGSFPVLAGGNFEVDYFRP